ncbi:hypothetical protein GGS20DRAFT_581147 [Poronia punctata]|nr:hypothetical protein GGS20DRAFT_581147 [Poronia punctata]
MPSYSDDAAIFTDFEIIDGVEVDVDSFDEYHDWEWPEHEGEWNDGISVMDILSTVMMMAAVIVPVGWSLYRAGLFWKDFSA